VPHREDINDHAPSQTESQTPVLTDRDLSDIDDLDIFIDSSTSTGEHFSDHRVPETVNERRDYVASYKCDGLVSDRKLASFRLPLLDTFGSGSYRFIIGLDFGSTCSGSVLNFLLVVMKFVHQRLTPGFT
jgi:hypothetical protein